MNNFRWKKSMPYFVGVLLFIIISLAYMNPVLEGRQLMQQDVIRHKGMAKEILDFREKTGQEALWTNSMFSGMPAYQISVKYPGNLVQYMDKAIRLGLPRPADYVFLYMLGFFILLLVLKVDPWLSLVGALAFGFSSYFFIILEAGHNSKAHAIGYMAPVIAGIILTYRGKYLAGGALTLLAMALEVLAGHPQITYYLGLLLLIYGVFKLVEAIRKKNYIHFGKATLVVIVAVGIAVLTNITSLWATYEYGKYTIRGKSELTTEKDNRTSGLDKDYATQWSYGISESMSLFIPNVNGGGTRSLGEDKGNLENVDPNYKEYVARANQYFGTQPFTSGPVYAGALVFLFFILGLFIVQGQIKWWLLAGTLFSILLAWGKNFMGPTEFFLDYFPMYNKFRAVSMILVLAEITMPLLAVLALNEVYKSPEVLKQKIKIGGMGLNVFWLSLGFSLFIALIFALVPSLFLNFLTPDELAQLAKQKASNPTAAGQYADLYANIAMARESIVKSDALRSLLFVVFGGASVWLFSLGKLKKGMLTGILLVLVVFDMWGIDKRYLNDDNFVSSRKLETPYAMSQADKIILKDKDPDYRVLNFTVDPFADASTSYWHKSIGGYHAAKLRRYQELYDHHIKKNFNIKVLNMLNTKYFIQPNESKKPAVVPNPRALGNAGFVKEINQVANADEELAALADFNPETTAVVNKKFSEQLTGFKAQADSSAQIALIEYQPNHLKYQSNTQSEQWAVFSEIYYEKGWNAYIDGEQQPYFRANYVLRAMRVPAGKHLIEFKFKPRVYRVGENISLVYSILLILILIGFVDSETNQCKARQEIETKD